MQDGSGFGHFDHEGGTSGSEVVRGADAGKNPVKRPQRRPLRGHETADVGEQGNQRGLPHVGGFTAHVGTGNQ